MVTIRPSFTASLALALAMFSGTASAQDTTAPIITFDAPTNGTVSEGSRITVSGTATDSGTDRTGTAGIIRRVQFRIEGTRRWRTATLVTPGEISTTYVFRVSLRQRQKRRIYVRALDNSRNESDIIGRRLRRGRR